MYTEDEFEAAIHELAQINNLPSDLAGELMVSIGDTPETDENGLVIAYAKTGPSTGFCSLRMKKSEFDGQHFHVQTLRTIVL